MRTLRIVDEVVEAIAATVGSRPPESGGGLLGVPDERLVTRFLFDPTARTGASVYHNSEELIQEIAKAEQETSQRFVGILHSHPRSLARPSGQDRFEFATALAANPDLPLYVSPIVTFDDATPLSSHELMVGNARVSFFATARGTEGPQLERIRPRVLPAAQSLRAVDESHTPIEVADVHDTVMLVSRVVFRTRQLTVLMPLEFPVTPPLVIADGTTLPLKWSLDVAPGDRLVRALDAAIPVDERDPAPPNARAPREVTAEDLRARSAGLLSEEMRDRSVLLIGAGSVGSDLAEGLIRSGVGRLTILDPDSVDPHNLGRSRFDEADVGTSKAEALASRLRRISRHARIDPIVGSTADLPLRELARLTREADVVVAATDDSAAQSLADRLARRENRPAVFVGLYARAAGGEVIVTREGLPCWLCATGGVRTLDTAETARRTDYGTGRLAAEPGLVTDIQFVSAAATRIVLGLLDRDGAATSGPADTDRAGVFLERALNNGQSYVVFSMRPEYWIFPSALRDAAGQHALQSLWMRVEARSDCAVCGTNRTDPLDFDRPALVTVRRLWRQARSR